MADGDRDAPVSIFHPTYLILVAGVSNAFLAGDLFNLYVGFEILLTASYVLITLGGTGPRIRAGVDLRGGLASCPRCCSWSRSRMIYARHRHGQHGGPRRSSSATSTRAPQTLLHVMLLVAFGIKAAVFPLSFWLPDSYPTAPGPGHRGVRRAADQGRRLRDRPHGDAAVPGGRAQRTADGRGAADHGRGHPRRPGAESTSSGSCPSPWSATSATWCSASPCPPWPGWAPRSSTWRTTSLSRPPVPGDRPDRTPRRHSSLDRLGGLAKLSPVLAVLFFIPAMNLAGIPPFSGFLGKLGLLQAGVRTGRRRWPTLWSSAAC